MARTVMVCGIGAAGGMTVEFLARSEGVDRIVTSDISEEIGIYKTNAAAIGSVAQGFSKKFEFHRNDVNDIDATARLVAEIKPEVILFSVTNQPLRVLRGAPQDIRDKLDMVGISVWLPWNLPLPAKFMQAVNKSGIQTHVVSIPLPDMVNPAIWKHFGYGATVGAGNHQRIAHNIIKHVSTKEGVPVQDVVLYFVGSHALAEHGSKEGVPFFLKIVVGDRDITSKYDVNWLTEDCPVVMRTPIVRQKVELLYPCMAAIFTRTIMAIVRDTNELTCVPSPNGLVGGYPVRLSAKGAKVVLPKELTLEQAVKMNEDAEKFDGIEKIKDDGTIVYTDKNYSIMKELGYDCKELPFDELEARSEELMALTKRWFAL